MVRNPEGRVQANVTGCWSSAIAYIHIQQDTCIWRARFLVWILIYNMNILGGILRKRPDHSSPLMLLGCLLWRIFNLYYSQWWYKLLIVVFLYSSKVLQCKKSQWSEKQTFSYSKSNCFREIWPGRVRGCFMPLFQICVFQILLSKFNG